MYFVIFSIIFYSFLLVTIAIWMTNNIDFMTKKEQKEYFLMVAGPFYLGKCNNSKFAFI